MNGELEPIWSRKYRITLITPAYNEPETIGTIVQSGLSLVREGHIQNFYVIDDGSTDGTAEIARGMGAMVHSLKTNLGKAAAVFYGMLLAARNGSDILITIDADLRSPLKQVHVKNFVDTLEGYNYHEKVAEVAVYPVLERGLALEGWEKELEGCPKSIGEFTNINSGNRAFRLERFNFLFRRENGRVEFSGSKTAMRFRSMASGYGLEDMLNHDTHCARVERYDENPLVFLKSYRNGRENKQNQDLERVQNEIDERGRKYRVLMEKRMKRKGSQSDKDIIYVPKKIRFGDSLARP